MKVSEYDIQRDVFEWAKYHPKLNTMYATASGIKLGWKTLRKALLCGIVKKGLVDIVVPRARKGYHGLYIELKTETGRLSPEQALYLKDLSDEGYLAVVCYGFEQTIKVIGDYIND